jgi:hypothetical protein
LQGHRRGWNPFRQDFRRLRNEPAVIAPTQLTAQTAQFLCNFH